MATKFVTAFRLKDLKAKLEAIQPDIDELRTKVAEAEDEYEGLKMKEEATTTRLAHVRGVVNYLENQVKGPSNDGMPDERQQVLQSAEGVGER